MSTELKTAPRSSLLNYAQSSEQWLCAVQNFLGTIYKQAKPTDYE